MSGTVLVADTERAELVVFRLDGQRYALRLGVIERFVRAVEVTPLPGAPAIVLGAIDVGGSVLPVLSLRRRFGLPEREVDVTDQFLIARTSSRTVALVVDEALGVITVPTAEVTGAGRIVRGLEHVQGVVTLDDGLVLIHDLETCLSLDEECALAQALEAQGYRVLSTSSGEEALRVIEDGHEPWYLLLTDVVLSGEISGRVLAERVRALRPDLKVLFVSGYTSDVTILHGLLEQSVALVQKPFTAELLGRKVREVLDAK